MWVSQILSQVKWYQQREKQRLRQTERDETIRTVQQRERWFHSGDRRLRLCFFIVQKKDAKKLVFTVYLTSSCGGEVEQTHGGEISLDSDEKKMWHFWWVHDMLDLIYLKTGTEVPGAETSKTTVAVFWWHHMFGDVTVIVILSQSMKTFCFTNVKMFLSLFQNKSLTLVKPL